MKACWIPLLALMATSAAADPFFTGNPWSPIPPGCVTRPDLQREIYGDHSTVVFDGEGRLRGANKLRESISNWLAEPIPADILISRILCAEPGRSALFVEFGFGASLRYTNQAHYLRPDFWADTQDGQSVGWFMLLNEAGSARAGGVPNRSGRAVFGNFADGWEYLDDTKWAYLLDLTGPLPGYKDYSPRAAEAYNDDLRLFGDPLTWDEPLVAWKVPATVASGAAPTRMPLNGRHSGTWIIEGARDQGISLAFSNRVAPQAVYAGPPEWAPLFLFLTWYTFDADGRMIWLTGTGEFPQGADAVELDLSQTQGGAFMGETQAQRIPVGTATLVASSCANLTLEYDLQALNLGSGTMQLRRLHELEVAGYNCRDHDARRTAAFGADR